ncbi:zinc metallopeptidase [Aquisalimonas sp.]|uniref:zinc metallopeptidase n=1 Tax=Aquisalimonas sp. TaxID=1872621 RepID=UPI0025BC8DA5|nr:zinc metallopeptidase [Aquisalimonas sp.]
MLVLLILAGVILVAASVPGLWVRWVMRRYHRPADRYQGTGAELARHLLDRLELSEVRVEKTQQGDHYDPLGQCVRLSSDNHDGRSLTAVTVAAHEVGHAVQDAMGYRPLHWRTRLARWASAGQRMGVALLLSLPVLLALTRSPALLVPMVALGLGGLAMGVLVHLVTLPTELDASFRRALPLLEAGYLRPEDRPHARRILRAAALTYVSAAAMSLLNIWLWLRLLRP